MIQNNYNDQTQALLITFIPGCYNVICARGKKAKNHSGNKFYQKLIKDAIPQYNQATSKLDKSIIVKEILNIIQTSSPDSGFIKKKKSGSCCCYYQVSDHFAREKIGQNLRDKLSNKYRSSTKAKRRRRVATTVSTKILDATTIEINDGPGQTVTPELIMDHLFIQMNKEMLEANKKDEDLLQNFIDAERSYKLGQQ